MSLPDSVPENLPGADTAPAYRHPPAWYAPWARMLPLLVLLLVLLLAVFLSAVVAHFTQEQQRVRFQRETGARTSALQSRVGDFDKLLQATRAFWLANPVDVRPENFNEFSDALNLSDRYPEVLGLGYMPLIPTGQEKTLETLVASLGVARFQVYPLQTDQPTRTPIMFIAPQTPTNLAALGYDMMSSPQRRDALLRSSRSNSFQVSVPVSLVQRDPSGKPYPGFLVMLPVWLREDNAAIAQPDRDHNNLSGFIYLAIRSDLFLSGLDSAYRVGGIQSRTVLDGIAMTNQPAPSGAFNKTDKLRLGGLNWEVSYAAPAGFGSDVFGTVPYITLLVGLLIAGFAYLLMQAQVSAREKAEKANRNLRLAQDWQEQARAEFEAIFQSMQDAAAVTDAEGRIRMVNRAMNRQFGYRRGDLEGQPLSTLHVDRHLDQTRTFQALTTPYHRRDGSRFQGETQRTEVRDAGGNLLGILEVVRDVTERIQSEQAIQNEERRSRAVLDAIPHILWVSNPAGEVTYMNAQHRRRLGQMSVRESIHTQDLATYDQMWQDAYLRRSRAHCEVRLLASTGLYPVAGAHRSRWFEVRVAPLLDAQGAAREWVASATDIHDRLVAERLAQRNEARYRGVLQGMPQIVWLADTQGQFTYFNRRWQDYVGEEQAGLGLAAAIHPSDRPDYLSRWNQAVAEGRAFEAEHRLLGADGRYRTFVTRGLPVRDAQNQIIEWVGTSTDVDDSVYAEYTARLLAHISDELNRRVNDPLAIRGTKYDAVLRLLTERLMVAGGLWTAPELELLAVVSPDPNWSLPHLRAEVHERVRQAAYSEELLDIPTHPLLHVVAASGALVIPLIGLDGTLRGVLGLAYRHELRDRDHELLMEVASRLAEALDNDALRAHAQQAQAELVALNLSLEDRVQRRTLELQEANRELEAFSYSVSHDLRTPLRHVVSFGEMLKKDSAEALSPKSARYLSVMTEAAGRMNTLIDSLLEFSRMGRTPLRSVPIDLGPLVARAWQNLEPDRQGRQIEYAQHELPSVQGDANLLDLVFQNLLSNAIKYTRKEPQTRIEVGASREHAGMSGETVTVFVRDNGAGFDPRYTDKLFGVFQRLHRAEEFEGTGIGLANVRRIVMRHGGSIRAESVLGEGATFYVTLPVNPPAGES